VYLYNVLFVTINICGINCKKKIYRKSNPRNKVYKENPKSTNTRPTCTNLPISPRRLLFPLTLYTMNLSHRKSPQIHHSRPTRSLSVCKQQSHRAISAHRSSRPSCSRELAHKPKPLPHRVKPPFLTQHSPPRARFELDRKNPSLPRRAAASLDRSSMAPRGGGRRRGRGGAAASRPRHEHAMDVEVIELSDGELSEEPIIFCRAFRWIR
jgi:hypothetical protein